MKLIITVVVILSTTTASAQDLSEWSFAIGYMHGRVAGAQVGGFEKCTSRVRKTSVGTLAFAMHRALVHYNSRYNPEAAAIYAFNDVCYERVR